MRALSVVVVVVVALVALVACSTGCGPSKVDTLLQLSEHAA